MKTLITSVVLSLAASNVIADTTPATLDEIAQEQGLEKVTKIVANNQLDTIRLDNRKGFIVESSRDYYLVTSHRKLRSWDIIKFDRTFSSISKSDVEYCERNAGCMGAGVKGFYKLGDKEAMKAFKASLKTDES